jgi:AhpD family alkylhydroperoxidase
VTAGERVGCASVIPDSTRSGSFDETRAAQRPRTTRGRFTIGAMPRRTIAEFRAERAKGQDALLASDHLGLKRFLRLDAATYEPGALDGRTKELLGLVASAVLRCNDCIDYHLEQCVKAGFTREEIVDALNVALVVGGSIVIPHARHAMLSLDELLAEKAAGALPP